MNTFRLWARVFVALALLIVFFFTNKYFSGAHWFLSDRVASALAAGFTLLVAYIVYRGYGGICWAWRKLFVHEVHAGRQD